MARGPSGKLVIEVDPRLKDALHARLAKEKVTVKEWFIRQAEDYLKGQEALPLVTYRAAEPRLMMVADSAQGPEWAARRTQ